MSLTALRKWCRDDLFELVKAERALGLDMACWLCGVEPLMVAAMEQPAFTTPSKSSGLPASCSRPSIT